MNSITAATRSADHYQNHVDSDNDFWARTLKGPEIFKISGPIYYLQSSISDLFRGSDDHISMIR